MKLRHPYCTATVWPSGKITCTGTHTEEDAKKAARRIARIIQRLGFDVRFKNYRVVNVVASCAFPFGIRISQFASANRSRARYMDLVEHQLRLSAMKL